MRKRFLTVPQNLEGVKEYNYGVEESDNIQTYHLPEEEFVFLVHRHIFSEINEKCNTLIDDYESEEITDNQLKECLEIVKPYAKNIPVFFGALEYAYKKNTMLALDF